MAMQSGQTEVGASELNVQLGKSRAFSNVPWPSLSQYKMLQKHVPRSAASLLHQVSKDFLMVVCERADEVVENGQANCRNETANVQLGYDRMDHGK